jgi:hypothetical protein
MHGKELPAFRNPLFPERNQLTFFALITAVLLYNFPVPMSLSRRQTPLFFALSPASRRAGSSFPRLSQIKVNQGKSNQFF